MKSGHEIQPAQKRISNTAKQAVWSRTDHKTSRIFGAFIRTFFVGIMLHSTLLYSITSPLLRYYNYTAFLHTQLSHWRLHLVSSAYLHRVSRNIEGGAQHNRVEPSRFYGLLGVRLARRTWIADTLWAAITSLFHSVI